MNKAIQTLILVLAFCFTIVSGYFRSSITFVEKKNFLEDTSLFAHHVNKKITKRMMDRRPKKHRPSDITRNNVNFGKCITKIENAPSEYTIISAEDYMKVREQSLKFWEDGDSGTEWLEITAEDMLVTLCPNVDPLPEGGVQKKPPLVRSGTW